VACSSSEITCTISCPIFDGLFEIGQGAAQGTRPPLECNLGNRNVWSAAHNPESNNRTEIPIDPPPPSGTCFPDQPPDSGCPLYPEGEDSFDPNGTVCKAVCDAYKVSDDDGIQVGYTCDAALCTTLGLGPQELPWNVTMGERFGLMGRACSGVQNLGGLDLIMQVETLAGCSCCASQICGCAEADITFQTNSEIFDLNKQQTDVGIQPQCEINGTLCGEPVTVQ